MSEIMNYYHNNLITLFDEVCLQYPDFPAIKDKNKTYTYNQLHVKVSNTAKSLVQKLKIGEPALLVSDKDVNSMIYFWAIIKAGGVPVILDAHDGVGPNLEKVKDIRFDLIIAQHDDYIEAGAALGKNNIRICDSDSDYLSYDNCFEFPVIQPTSLCYILLTSGTTGRSKAVKITHSNVMHYIYSLRKRLDLSVKTNTGHVTTFAADLGLTNVLVSLITGGLLRIFEREESADPVRFFRTVRADKIGLMKMTPSHFLSLLTGYTSRSEKLFETLILGGEKLNYLDVKKIYDSKICESVYNHYGPTETTIGALMHKITHSFEYENGSVPIGTPLGDGICILDEDGDVAGELLIGGPGVCDGYLNGDKETEPKFVRKLSGDSEILYYRTGDHCSRNEMGEFVFEYRIDRQVKVRGFRVELGEIEQCLSQHPEILMATVAVTEGGKLEAYIKTSTELDIEKIRKFLRNVLPEYKIPSDIFSYKLAPYTSNGKLDLKALRLMFKKPQCLTVELPIPQDGWSKDVSINWAAILENPYVLPSDNFFLAGGDSLLAIQFVGRLQRCGYPVSISHLNSSPVYMDFMGLDLQKETVTDGAFVETEGRLTNTQRQFLNSTDFDVNRYNQSILLDVFGELSINHLSTALNYVLQSHTVFSSIINTGLSTPISNTRNFTATLSTHVLVEDRSVYSQIDDVSAEIFNQISVADGCCIRASYFINSKGRDLLLISSHHLLIDVISWKILIEELLEFYEQLHNGQAPVVKHERLINEFYNELDAKDLSYEGNSEVGAVIRIPLFANKEEIGDHIEVLTPFISETIIQALRSVEESHSGKSVPSYLLAAMSAAMLECFGIEKLTVDVEYHGRPQELDLPDLSRSIGWWSSTLPMDISTEMDIDVFNDLLDLGAKRAVANNLRQDVQSLIASKADVRFNYLGHFPAETGNGERRLAPSHYNAGTVRDFEALNEYGIFFTARFIGDMLYIDIQYHVKRIPRNLITDITKSFVAKLTDSLINDSQSNAKDSIVLASGNLSSVGLPLYSTCTYKSELLVDNILLTGSTGYLGVYILQELLLTTDTVIYCTIRAEGLDSARLRLLENYQTYFGKMSQSYQNRIRFIAGDLAAENFGISDNSFLRLASEIELVIHAAADINLFKDSTQSKRSNIAITENVIRFAEIGVVKPIHYVSTLAVSGRSTDSVRHFTEADFDYGQMFLSGYEEAKFEAERLIRTFINKHKKGKIYRSGHIAADSKTGACQKDPMNNRIYQLLGGFYLVGEVPSDYNEKISFSYVDVVAKGLVRFCFSETPLSCIHLENEHYLNLRDLINVFIKLGVDIKLVDRESFRSTVNRFLGSKREMEAVALMSFWLERYYNVPRNIIYRHLDSLNELGKRAIYFQKPSMKWLTKMLIKSQICDAQYIC